MERNKWEGGTHSLSTQSEGQVRILKTQVSIRHSHTIKCNVKNRSKYGRK